jgi:hypothetical protein
LILAIASMVWRLAWGQTLLWYRKIKHLPIWLNVVLTSNISLNMFLYTYKLAWHTHRQPSLCPRKVAVTWPVKKLHDATIDLCLFFEMMQSSATSYHDA